MKSKFLTLILLLIVCQTLAQDWKRTMNWYFGDKAGLSFATNPPTPLIDGMMGAIEGCATISDTAGNLLFYTQGNNVWNRNHQIMPNGTGLLGHGSSTQVAVVVPQPGNDSLFYVFTTAQTGQPNGFRYSIVNLNRNGGLGDVVVKNVLLQTPVCEKLASTKHANGKDYWVLAHGFGNDLFYAYLVTEHGIVSCPVVSKIGSVHANSDITNAIGTMNFSSDGKKIAACQYDLNRVELFDFDASAGTLSNFIYAGGVTLPYSVMFSSNNRYIYVTSRLNYFYQYNISFDNSVIITNSRVSIYTPPNTVYSYYTYLQVAADNKIYAAMVDSTFIGVINHPDSAGAACDFEEKGIDLNLKASKYGLPNFVSSYFYRPSADFVYDLDCRSNEIRLKATDTIGAGTYQWIISKSTSETRYANPLVYQFTDTGNYTVELLAVNGSDTARQSKRIFITPTYSLNLGNDTVLCEGETLMLGAGSGQFCYQWNDSSTGTSLNVDTTGLYYVKVVSNGYCTYFDSIRVSFISSPSTIQIERSGDTLFASDNFDRYQWKRNNITVQDSSLRYHVLASDGNYTVEGSDSLSCFTVSSAVFIVDTLTGFPPITKSDFGIYPNPANTGSVLTIEPVNGEINLVELYTIEGRLIWIDTEPNPSKHYTYPLTGGIYILSINGLYNYKIIVN